MTTTAVPPDVLRSRLGFPVEATASLARIVALAPMPRSFVLPGPDETRDLLLAMGVSPDACEEAAHAVPSADTHPEAFFVLERMHHEIVCGDADPLWWPWPHPADAPLERYFQLYAFLAALPHTRASYASRGIPEDVMWDTLQDVALAVESYRTRHGRAGFDSAFWFAQHFRARTFRLGRLLFNVWQVVFDPGPGAGFEECDPAVGVHMPAYGRLEPQACDESFERARAFFPGYFSEITFGVMTCASWLLDPQLAEYLPETSNIVRFQHRFELARSWTAGDDAVVRFVFGYEPSSIDDLPQRTTLERAIVGHLRAGRHWRIRQGWLVL
ncbi:MAG: acyltransferase domain-containing protein [Candidatus Binatia bacterium]